MAELEPRDARIAKLMQTMLRGMLLLVLAGCAGGPAVLNQAQAVPVRPEPLPAFPQPLHTPVGAGASPPGIPWQAPESRVERSPNKRVLPVDPTDPAPGLWAADEVRGSATKYYSVADIELPLPDSDVNALETQECAYRVGRLLKSEGQMGRLMELRFVDRQCVVAQLHEYCWGKGLEKATSPERRRRFEAAVAEIHNFVLYACRDTREGKRSTEKIRSAVTSVWDIAERTKKR
jgi:hypothetical protein